MKMPRCVLILLALCESMGVQGHAQEWKVAKTGDGIEVSTRVAPGWGMKEFRAITRVHARLSSIVALLEDVEAYPKWFADCKETSVLKSAGPLERWVYFVNSAPFPLRDRDMISHMTFSQDLATGAVTVVVRGDPDVAPNKPGRIRVPRLEGFWRFIPLKEGEVEVQYQIRSDPGGSIPTWLANSTVADAPWKTFAALRRMVAAAKYQTARSEWVKE
jgi:ribosome-associated toxin RatA of RatAB toxin-antitoxin module